MYVLGLGGSNHGFSACLVKDKEIVCMTSEERITRKKYGVGLGVDLAKGFSRNYCLEQAGISIDDVSLIVGNDIMSPYMYFRMNDKINLINHHMAHICSVYFPSKMEEAAILVMDGVGSKVLKDGELNYESMTLAYAQHEEIKILKKQYGTNLKGTDYIENSLGIFYQLITEIIGFGEHEEGKSMGLAPYGSKEFYHKINRLISYRGNGNISLKLKDIEEMLQLKEDVSKITDEVEKLKICSDIAWAGQKVLEDVYTNVAEYLWNLTHCKNLCIAGGVALNSVANYKIYKMNLFENIFVQPAAGDDGTAIGAALYGSYFGDKFMK